MPVDFNRNWSDGRRILGNGKTWRGLVCGVLAGILIGLVQIWLVSTYHWDLPQHTLLSVTLLALGALLGDMGKSFFKRRLGRKERGDAWPVADQYDLVVGAFVLTLVFDPAWFLLCCNPAGPYCHPCTYPRYSTARSTSSGTGSKSRKNPGEKNERNS